MKKLLIIMLLFLSFRYEAQQMLPHQKGLEISYGLFPKTPEKLNYYIGIGVVSYAKNGNYIFGNVEYSRKYLEYFESDIPYDSYLFGAGYSFYLFGDLYRNVNINLGIGGLAGYEQMNQGEEHLVDGAQLNNTEQLIYGALGRLTLESYLTSHLVFLVEARLNYLQNSLVNSFQTKIGIGFRYNF